MPAAWEVSGHLTARAPVKGRILVLDAHTVEVTAKEQIEYDVLLQVVIQKYSEDEQRRGRTCEEEQEITVKHSRSLP